MVNTWRSKQMNKKDNAYIGKAKSCAGKEKESWFTIGLKFE